MPFQLGKLDLFFSVHLQLVGLLKHCIIYIYIRSTPHPVTVTTRIITFLVRNPYKPSFATVTGWGVDPIYSIIIPCFVVLI